METTRYSVIDMHTAGEPVRIVTGGYPRLTGRTILEKRREARERFDHIRQVLMLEPRGHAGMYGVIPTEPCCPESDLAVLFTHNEGYSTMCGHATIAVGRWAVESGRVRAEEPVTRFRLEVPCGILNIESIVESGRVRSSTFESVPSFASLLDCRVEVPGLGRVDCDIAFGGAFYAILPASRAGLPFGSTPLAELVDAGIRITEAIRASIPIRHPDEPDLGFLYGTILTDDVPTDSGEPSHNLCIFAEGQIDRSPTGSGATARMALDYARGRIGAGQEREFRGVSGVGFSARISEASGGGFESRMRVRVGGSSSVTGETTFLVEEDDPLPLGFELPRTFSSLRGTG
jgi:proline racemase